MPSPISSPRPRLASLRGLLLSLVAIVGVNSYALTITQTASFDTAGFLQGNGFANAGLHWTTFDPFAVEGGTLLSVQFEAKVTASIEATEVNPFSTPFTLTPFVSLTSFFSYSFPGTTLTLGSGFDSQSFPSFEFNPGNSHTVAGDLTRSFNVTVTDAGVLAALSAGGTDSIELVLLGEGYSAFGLKSINAHTDLKLTYTYGVPDTSTTLILLGLALTVLGVAQGRLKRLPGMAA